MNRTMFRTLFTLLLASVFSHLQADSFYGKEEVQARLESMECIVKPRYTTRVENYIKGYFVSDAWKARVILKRSVTYFPIFEKYLAEHNLPADLKYLAVLESALNPKAVSRVGAVGLWQFMKETGTGYGLKINSRIDERSCPNRSTVAAMKYLSNAYERFGSWELAIASYNCGAGNIRKAIRRSGGKTDYWEICKYLPRETRNFVPAFLGAAYMIKFYHQHAVVPEYRHLDLQLTDSELVFMELPFDSIAAVTGIPVSVVEALNPAYKKGYVPANTKGHWVVLPLRTMQALRDYVQLLKPDKEVPSEIPPLPALVEEDTYAPDDFYFKTFYTALEGDRLEKLGQIFSCSGYNLQVWNNLATEQLTKGQELIVWFPKELKRYRPFSEGVEVLEPVMYIPRTVKNVKIPAPELQPIELIKLTPIPVGQYTNSPLMTLSVASAEMELEKGQKMKKLNLQKMKKWIAKKQFIKKIKKEKGNKN